MKKISGYTLIELSMVIVIASSLIAVITYGISLSKSYTIASQIKQLAELETAFVQFKTTYNAIPGDMNNASTVLGSLCNGNGNGVFPCCDIDSGERQNVANHLYLAGLIPTKYDCGGSLSLGNNIITGAFDYNVAVWIDTNGYWGVYGDTNHFMLSGITGLYNPIIPVRSAIAMDRKIDDGLPGTGKLIGMNEQTAYNCSSVLYQSYPGTIPSNQAYASTSSGVCTMAYGIGDYKFVGGGI
jgi:prepilin-type N-terminal cleavage/methylation domain-containing protein